MEPDRMVASIRNVAGNADRRIGFINEGVKKAKELQGKSSQEYENVVSSLLHCLENFDVIAGSSLDIMCELTVLDILYALDLSALHMSLCNSYICLCLKGVQTTSDALAATKTFSETLNFSMNTEFVRGQIDESIQWISANSEKPLIMCGILVVTEVALKIPMILMQRLAEILEKLWDGLAHHDSDIRTQSLKLFSLCTKLLSSRTQAIRAETVDPLMQHLKNNLASKSRDKIIAGLLAFEPIVMNSGSPIRYEDLSIMLVPFILSGGSSSNSSAVRHLVFRCLVVLCKFSTSLFVANQLKDTVRFALSSVDTSAPKSPSFEMLSEIIPIVGKIEYDVFVEETCAAIMSIFVEHTTPCWDALRCFSIICKVCSPPQMESYVDCCIERVFKWGLSTQLIDCMRDIIASSSAHYRVKLEESLLDMISVTLCGLPFRQQHGTERISDLAPDGDASDDQLSVALNALKQFGFSNSELMGDFLRDSVLPFIDNSSAAVRNAAISTIVTLLIPSGEKGDLSIARRMCVDTVVSRMLVVGASDPNPVVRQTILSAFTEDFYPFLSEPQFLFRFYSALGDESINCRVAAIEQLCHMIKYDPSHVLPALREEMAVILHFITTTFNPTAVQNGLRLLTATASKAPHFVVNFTEGILSALKPYFTQLSIASATLLPFLHCCTAFATAVHRFSKRTGLFNAEIADVCEFLDSLTSDRSFHAARLSCLRFLSATLGPLVDGESPYRVYPKLFPLLSAIIRSAEDSMDIRLEALKCMGTIGALDSHRFQSFDVASTEKSIADMTVSFNRVTHQECCNIVLTAIATLLDPNDKRSPISRDGVLRASTQTILSITERCPCSREHMMVIVEPLARVICQLQGGRLLATILYEFTSIVRFVGENCLSCLNAIYIIFNDIWERQRPYRFLAVRMLSVVAGFETTGSYHCDQQKARILPQLFDVITRTDSPPDVKYAVLEYIVRHVKSLQGCCETVVDNLLVVIKSPNTPTDLLNATVTTLNVVASKLYVDELVGAIVRSLLVCMSTVLSQQARNNTSLFDNIMSVFCVICVDLQADFLKYAAYINQTLKTYRVSHAEFTSLTNQVASGMKCSRPSKSIQTQNVEVSNLIKKCEAVILKSATRHGEVWSHGIYAEEHSSPTRSCDEKDLPIGEQRILACIKNVPVTKEEWAKWLELFSLSILQESPYQVFRCTSLQNGINAAPLTEKCPQFMQEVVQFAFRTLWTYASANLRTSIVEFLRASFRQAMTASTIPDDVLGLQLSIVEYMDHAGETLSISYMDLSECAWSRGMLAKALYWREAAYREDPSGTVESLISLYSELHMVDSSVGILNQTSEPQRRGLLHSSLVKLARYTEALQLTQQERENECGTSEASSCESISRPFSFKAYCGRPRMMHIGSSSDGAAGESFSRADDASVSRRLDVTARLMLCLSELGDYDKVLSEWSKIHSTYQSGKDSDGDDGNILSYVSQYAADAAVRLQAWDTLSSVVKWMPHNAVNYYVSQAALHLAADEFDQALSALTAGRRMLLEDLSGLLHESYARGYEGLVVAQQLTEVEEAIFARRWEKVLQTSDYIPLTSKVWDQRTRMMMPTVTAWKQVLGIRGLLIPPAQDVRGGIRFIKLCRQENAKQLEKFTLDQLLGYSNPSYEQLTCRTANPRVVMRYISYLADSNLLGEGSVYGTESELIKKMIDVHVKGDNRQIMARAYASLGAKVPTEESVDCYKSATLYDPKWFLAWRMWAETNTKLLSKKYTDECCANAIDGYIRSIQLGTSDSTLLQDVLKLLTLWSSHCDQEQGLKSLRNRVFDVPTTVWYLVVPQLIARLDSGSDESCHLVADILMGVAYDYPHTLLYPLNLCIMSDSERRKKWANDIVGRLQAKFPIIVLQGRLVVDELIRTSSLIYEQWYDKLESAATAFFGRHNKEEMIRTLLPMHDTLTRVPETMIESEFIAKYRRLLSEAKEWLRSYTTTRSIADIHAAWNVYHGVYRMIDEQIKASSYLNLQFCSPKLFEARDLAVGLPDARPTKEEPVVKIQQFDQKINVISSKQRPKRISITTPEGRTQKFLLKGREDLRLDERVMQLFGLINILMLSDSRSRKNSGFQIQRYSVTPLKDTVGLIGWVDGCDTLYELVKYYRERKGIHVELESKMLNQIITFDNPKAYDYLSTMSKVEVMEFLGDHTSGHDIRKAMWSASPNCEAWLEQRHMFTSSLANMSAAGYILGLGDRHPNNIMLQRSTGLVVHIDFGDCFEVTMTRDKFPEKVPFRLTRMLRNALDVSGVDGEFRSNAETVMCVLREGNHSVIALLEAFIQDPLISWRLINRPGQEPESSNDHKTIDEQITMANLRPGAHTQPDSMSASVDGGRRCTGSSSIAKYLFGEEVDVVHQGVFILKRLSSKLKGEDFMVEGATSLDPKTQVGRLIQEATDITNVAQSWSGWYPFW